MCPAVSPHVGEHTTGRRAGCPPLVLISGVLGKFGQLDGGEPASRQHPCIGWHESIRFKRHGIKVTGPVGGRSEVSAPPLRRYSCSRWCVKPPVGAAGQGEPLHGRWPEEPRQWRPQQLPPGGLQVAPWRRQGGAMQIRQLPRG